MLGERKPAAAEGPVSGTIAGISRSVYRGQSRRGIGEGPGLPITHGEQYLENTDKGLARDGALLEDIRNWMSLDSDPEDHRLLEDRLEGWSYFSRGDEQFVVRLVSAGTYSHGRAAYFAHGRAWSTSRLAKGFDPGAHLGRHEMFEEPFRNDDPGQRRPEVVPAVVRPHQLKAEGNVAVQYLAHFYQALCEDYPLIIAAPISDFRTGSPLHALVSVARAGLPVALKRGCRIRVYTRLPELFLVQQQANLVVVPEAVAGDALAAAQPKPVLLDRKGQVLTGNRELHHGALSYARKVLGRALKLPQGLLLFTERYQDRLGAALPSAEDVEAVPVIYNLAYGAASEERDGLIDYLLQQAQELGPSKSSDPPRWQRLIGSDEWNLFPAADLCRVLFEDPEDLKAGGSEFQHEVEAAVGRLNLDTGDYLRKWWDARDERKQRRLQQLLAHRPPLVSERSGVDILSGVPIDRLAATGPVAGLLEAERKAGIIGRRNKESVELAKLADDRHVRAVLSRATSEGALGHSWAYRHVRAAGEYQLLAMARELLPAAASWDAWGNVPRELFDAVRLLQVIPEDLRPGILGAAQALKPIAHFDVYLRLADTVTRIDAVDASLSDNPLVAGLMAALPELAEPKDREFLIGAAVSEDWPCVTPEILAQWLPLASWDEQAVLLINESAIREALSTPYLLRLGSRLADAEGEALRQLYATLDHRMSSEPDVTTRVVIKQGWWWGWRRHSKLPADQQREAALKWLGSDAWSAGEVPEATLEVWNQVMDDLKPGGLSGLEMKRLCGGELGVRRTFWPSITLFENQQLYDLCQRATDLGALLELAESVNESELSEPLGDPVARHVLVFSNLQGELPDDSLHWLKAASTELPIEAPDLTLKQAGYLHEKSGHLQDRADEAREKAVAKAVLDDLEGALDAADELSLWRTSTFLVALTDMLFSLGSAARLGALNAARIDSSIDRRDSLKLERPPKIPYELANEGRSNIAEFLRPGIGEEIQKESLPGRVLRALTEGLPLDKSWKKAAQHPEHEDMPLLSFLAFKIRHEEVGAETLPKIRKKGWATFRDAVKHCHWLLRPDLDPEAGLPALYLAASLLGAGKVGRAAQQIICMDASARYRRQRKWWRALLQTLLFAPSRCVFWSADDRPDLALRLILKTVSRLSEAEQKSFRVAMHELRGSERAESLMEEFEPRRPKKAA